MGTRVSEPRTAYSNRDHPHACGDKLKYRLFLSCPRDHPHACGDKRSPSFVIVSIRGSSPRVWGQAVWTANTIFGVVDHPHACGDKHILLKVCNTLRGSSPRVWGQVVTPATFVVKVGIIPTRVGTSICSRCHCISVYYHPHACGDKQLTTLKTGL